jgi:hypothetical protein
MANCSGIFQGATISCDDPLSVGITPRILVANREDISTITYSAVAGESNVITGITMKLGKAFFEFAGVNESIRVQQELVRRAVSNGYKMTLDFSIFEVDNLSLLNMQAMAYKPQVAIAYGVDDSSLGNGAFQLLGADVGMDLLTNVRINADVDSGGGHVLQLSTADAGGDEKTLAPVIWSTDYDTTLTLINVLLTPVV